MRTALLASLLVHLLAGNGVAGDIINIAAGEASIQAAIDTASDGDTLLLAAGVHRGPGCRELNPGGKAITIAGEVGSDPAVIDCEGLGRAFDFAGGEGAGTVLQDLILSHGVSAFGAAIRCRGGSSPTIRRCVFLDNAANGAGEGGGIHCRENSSPSLEDCRFEGNSALGGAGVFCCTGASPHIDRCLFSGNRAVAGAAVHCLEDASPVLRHCRLEGNQAADGGGIYVETSTPVLEDCVIVGNLATAGGGAFIFASSPEISRCIFMGNLVDGSGGGACFVGGSSPILTNCLIVANQAALGGGTSTEFAVDRPVLRNCTLSANQSTLNSGALGCGKGASPLFESGIEWGNSSDDTCGDVLDSIVGDDPLFVRPGLFDFGRLAMREVAEMSFLMPDFIIDPGDYRLLKGSLAIDFSGAEVVPPDDLAGNARPCGAGLDSGAYEYCESVPVVEFRRGDANADGLTNIADASYSLEFLFLGGAAPPCRESLDVDDNGRAEVTDAVDLLSVLFLGVGAVAAPFAACGGDPTSDDLGCQAFPPCP